MTAIAPARPRKRGNPEHDVQRAIVALLRVVIPAPVVVHHAVNSVGMSGKRAAVQGGILKALGVHAGFSDLIVLAQGRAVFLEVKSDKGTLRASQVQFRDAVQAMGFPWALVRSADEALAAIEAAGIETRAKALGIRGVK